MKQCKKNQLTLLLVRKLTGWQEDSFSLPAGGSRSSNLIYLQDFLRKQKFLIDSGASLSVFPCPSSSSNNSNSDVMLITEDGSTMYCSGNRIIPLSFGSKSYDWKFHLAPVSALILGNDFLRKHHLIVNMAGLRVF